MCDSILKFIKLYFESDSNIISKATLGRAKAMNILTHCIKPVIQDKIEMIMKTKPFSLLIDDTTDKSKIRQMGIKIQFWDNETGMKCLAHSIVDASEITRGDEIVNEIMTRVLKTKLITNNLIGIAGDAGTPGT